MIIHLHTHHRYLTRPIESGINTLLNEHHILNAQILGQRPDYKLNSFHLPNSWMEINIRNVEVSWYILDLHDFHDLIQYTSPSGIPYKHHLSELFYSLLFSMENRRTEMRLALKKLDLDLPYQSFLSYVRQLEK